MAVVSIAWVLEDHSVVGRQLRAKLSVPNEELISALRSLTRPEFEELKRAVVEAFAKGRLPGGLPITALMPFLENVCA